MNKNKNYDRQQPVDAAIKPGLLGYAAAAALALPVGAVAWFELVYLWFGLTGDNPPEAFSLTAAFITFGSAFAWPLFSAAQTAEVVRRSCHLGLLVALLLPPATIAVLLLWQNASDRPDLGMGGLMLYSLPFVALGVSAVLVLVFGLGSRLARRKLYDRKDNAR